jgi:hypothetical protein
VDLVMLQKEGGGSWEMMGTWGTWIENDRTLSGNGTCK